MKIFGKMLLSFGIVIVLFLALCIFSLTQSSKLKSNGDDLNKNGIEPSVELMDIASLTENTRVQMLSAITFKNIDATKTALSNLDAIQTNVESLNKIVSKKNLKDAINTFNEKWLLFDERVRKNEQLMREGKWTEALEGLKIGGTLFNDAMDAFEVLQEEQINENKKIVDNNEKVYSNIFYVNISLMIITTITAIVLAYLFSRQIVKRLNYVTNRAKAIAAGDLSMDPINEKGKDEIKDLADNLNLMQDELIKVVSEAYDSSQQVSASAEQLTASTQQSMAAAESIAVNSQSSVERANTQLENLTTISTVLSNMDENLQAIAQNGTEMDKLSQNTFEKTHYGAEAVKEINKQIEKISTSSKKTEVAVQNLHKKSQEIGNIIGMITQISEQTNLLALNASIEAARAGEAGKGFAVVANEVKNLANQSHNSAEQIFKMINEIQEDISQVIESIHEEAECVNSGLNQSKEVNRAFDEIEEMVGTVTENARSLNDSIKSISLISQNILENTQQVHNLASQTLEDVKANNNASETQLGSIEEITAASMSLANLSEKLQSVILHFKLGNIH